VERDDSYRFERRNAGASAPPICSAVFLRKGDDHGRLHHRIGGVPGLPNFGILLNGVGTNFVG